MSKTVVIGVGNEFRSDDALGRLVARELRRRHLGEIRVVEVEGDTSSLLDAWEGAENLLIVDAVNGAGPPGSVVRIDVSLRRIPAYLFSGGSHGFGVAEAVELGRELKRLPPMVIFYGIVAESTENGQGLSDRVLKSIPDLLQMIEEDLHLVQAH